MRCFRCRGSGKVAGGFLGLGSKLCPDCKGTKVLGLPKREPVRLAEVQDDDPIAEVAEDAMSGRDPMASLNSGIFKLDTAGRANHPRMATITPIRPEPHVVTDDADVDEDSLDDADAGND